jgi:hypothetical protein
MRLLLRPAPGTELTGAELQFVDILGRPSATGPRRVQWRFVERGCIASWFWAGGSGDRAIATEGFLAKPLATLACGAPGVHIGWGARQWLEHKASLPCSIKQLIIMPDRRPAEHEVGADGKSLAEAHDRDYQRGIDRWLLELES